MNEEIFNREAKKAAIYVVKQLEGKTTKIAPWGIAVLLGAIGRLYEYIKLNAPEFLEEEADVIRKSIDTIILNTEEDN